MKTLPIKKHPDQKAKNVTSITFILSALKGAPASSGVTTETMRQRIKLIDKIEKLPANAKELKLEDTEQPVLLGAFKSAAWSIVDSFIVEVEDDILNAKSS